MHQLVEEPANQNPETLDYSFSRFGDLRNLFLIPCLRLFATLILFCLLEGWRFFLRVFSISDLWRSRLFLSRSSKIEQISLRASILFVINERLC